MTNSCAFGGGGGGSDINLTLLFISCSRIPANGLDFACLDLSSSSPPKTVTSWKAENIFFKVC